MITTAFNWWKDVMLLKAETISEHISAPGGLKRGLILIALAALLTGFFPMVSGLISSFRQPTREEIEQEVLKAIESQSTFNPQMRDPQFKKIFMENFKFGMNIGFAIAEIKPNLSFLPSWLDKLLNAIAAWLSTPFAWFGGWVWYALWVMLFAKLLKGEATLPQMLSATSLYAAPCTAGLITGLLDLAGKIPVAGMCFNGLAMLVGLGISLWSLTIYVKATAAANQFGTGKAVVAVLMPAVLQVILISFIIIALIAFIVIVSIK